MKNLTQVGAVLITAVSLLVVGVLATADWLKPEYAKFIATFLLGGMSGAALEGNFGEKKR